MVSYSLLGIVIFFKPMYVKFSDLMFKFSDLMLQKKSATCRQVYMIVVGYSFVYKRMVF